jgi:hypothetical protein
MSEPMSGEGDCFSKAIELLMAHPQMKLVHGVVTGTGGAAEGKRFVHAWCELGAMAIDHSNGHEVMTLRETYYLAGEVEHVRRYEHDEAVIELVRAGHYGPWDPALDGWL